MQSTWHKVSVDSQPCRASTSLATLCVQASERWLRPCSANRSLRSLDLSHCELTADGSSLLGRHLSKCTQLTSLSILESICSEQCIRSLQSCSLEHLSVGALCVAADLEGLAPHIAKLSDLQSLHALFLEDENATTVEFRDPVRTLSRLRTLHLTSYNLQCISQMH